MRTILVAAIAVLLGTLPAAADEECRTVGEVTTYARQQDESILYVVYSVKPLRLIFSKPDRDTFMIVQFDSTATPCMVRHEVLTSEQFKAWLNGEEQR